MKITFKMDTGTEVSTTPDQLVLANATPEAVVLGYRLHARNIVPIMNFGGQFFSIEELKAHDAAVSASSLDLAKKLRYAAAAEQASREAAAFAAAPAEAEATVHGGGSDPMGD